VNESTLHVQLVGPLRVLWNGEDITPNGPRARAVLAVLALADRPLPRPALAERIWGPNRLRNLRQELYNLRQLPGADQWLQLSRAEVGLRCVTDLAAPEGWGGTPAPVLLDGLSTLGTPALEDWLDTERHAFEARCAARVEGREDQLVALLAVAAPVAVTSSVLARVLDIPVTAVHALLEGVPMSEGTLSPRHVRPTLASLGPEAQVGLVMQLLAAEPTGELRTHLQARLSRPDALSTAFDTRAPPDLIDALEGVPEVQRAVYARWMGQVMAARDDAAIATCLAHLHDRALRTQAPPLLLESTHHTFISHLRAHRLLDARDTATELLRLADRHGTPDERGKARLCMGEVLRVRGEASESARWFTEAGLVPGASRRTSVVALNGAGAVAAMQGRLEDALHLHEEALARAREAGLRVQVARLLNSVGSDAVRLGRDRRAARAYREAATLALINGDHMTWATVLRNAAVAGIRGGRLGDARQDLHALEGVTGDLLPIHAVLVDEVRADFARAIGQLDDARALLDRALERSTALDNAARVRLAELNRAALLLQQGDASVLAAWTTGVSEVVADGDYMLAGECIADVLVWAAVAEAVQAARALQPTDRPSNPRLELTAELARVRLSADHPVDRLRTLLDTLPATTETARGWRVLVERGHPDGAVGLEECLAALVLGLTPDQAASLRVHHSQSAALTVP